MIFKIQPWLHQLEAIRRAEPLPYYGLFMDPGVGKTSTTINILRTKFNAQKTILRTLILAPPIVLNNWRDEWGKHSNIDLNQVVVLDGSGKKRLTTFNKHVADGPGRIMITNYEAMLMGDLYEAFTEWRPEALVLDESHKLKSYNAKRSKLVEALANPYDKKLKKPVKKPLTYILSGTPVLNSIQDLFMQFLILDGGATFGGNFFAFRARYMRDKNAGMPRDKYFPAWEVRPGAFEEVNKLIYHHAISAKKEECLDLPDLIKTTVKVQMAPEQARMYKEMKKDFITVLNDVACTATLAITKSLRLLQLSSGFVKLVDGEEVPLADNPKMAALKELLEEITPSHKVLIWCVFKQNYSQVRQVCESLGLELVEITGEQSPTQKNEGVERFKTDPKVRVLCGHPQSGGIGLNLIEASYMIFYSRSFSLENDIQAEARCYRGGSEVHSKITRIDLITEGTIDELASVSLANKQEVSMKVMREWAREED